ncbi:MAG: Motility protein B [Syntrophorhabdus sp. PtaU1.Bin153]|nr:MAG: Motility protein B [Syntrophorhabdus sp. PtaU1.Bin153]
MKILLIIVSALILVLGCASRKPSKHEVQRPGISSIESRQSPRTSAYQQLTRRLQHETRAGQVQINQFGEGVKIIISNDILFPVGHWKIHKGGEEVLDKIIPVVKAHEIQALEVCGFTDNKPVDPGLKERFSSNWELSGARAIDVVMYMEKKGVNPDIISATGYGDERPIASNDTPAGRRKNQRVEIIAMFSDS